MKSHLDVEHPAFAHKPHGWIQWKGTDVCMDVHCSCGEISHVDRDFVYFLRCPHCRKVWEVGTHIMLHDPIAEFIEDYVVEAEP